jgi:outer membrane protein assembly factor BamB
MNRYHLFYEDLNGDGAREIISEINGTWNRVTVWRTDGKALHDANFGPGQRIPTMNMRDLDVADLDGDGKMEIVTATSGGFVIALDHTCRKIWARRLSSPATVMKCVKPTGQVRAWVLAGCEDGTVIALDYEGQPIRTGKLAGRPKGVDALVEPQGGTIVLFSTDRGEVKAFRIGE